MSVCVVQIVVAPLKKKVVQLFSVSHDKLTFIRDFSLPELVLHMVRTRPEHRHAHMRRTAPNVGSHCVQSLVYRTLTYLAPINPPSNLYVLTLHQTSIKPSSNLHQTSINPSPTLHQLYPHLTSTPTHSQARDGPYVCIALSTSVQPPEGRYLILDLLSGKVGE